MTDAHDRQFQVRRTPCADAAGVHVVALDQQDMAVLLPVNR
jgi:hypothetical protein